MFRSLLLTALLASLPHAQSLEEKALMSHKLQAGTLSSEDQAMMDSLLNEKRKNTGPAGGTMSANGRHLGTARGQVSVDSMLAGPTLMDSLNSPDSLATDSLGRARPDSTLRGRRRARTKPLPARYEQRIFQSVDPSVFSSAGGSAGREYVLGPGDEIMVSLWGDKEKEYSLVLNKEGKIFLEGIGLVPVAGRNLDQAQELLKQKLAKVYSGIGRGTAHLDVSLGRTGPIRVFVLGEAKAPGGYVFTGHTSVLSALYYARGPTQLGSVRNLQLTRSGNKFVLDLYNYLVRGEPLSPQSLQDGDILFLPRATSLVEISGDIGRPATYELKSGEGVKELLEFAGGLNATAATHRLSLRRITPTGEAEYQDLKAPQEYLSGRTALALQDGDVVRVERSSETSRNYMDISGPVKYPGKYEATGVNTVQQLIEKAGGLREDAYLGRVHVLRFLPDGSSHLMAFSLDSTKIDTIHLEPRDNVLLYSIKDMYLPDSVQISGAVFNPGRYEFEEGITVKDLVMQAGGFLPHHEVGRVLVFRSNSLERKVEQIEFNMKDGLALSEAGLPLHPNDFVQVPVDPRWYVKEIVTLDGLFKHPGKYALLEPGESVASVVNRAGGFKENAYVEGGRFFRSKDSVGRVGVDLRAAVSHPHEKANISMVGGDSIFIPERLNTVKVIGEVGFETSVLFKSGAGVQYYIEKAGGFTRRSEKGRVVVQYANGETSRDGYFNRKPDAGSVIYVPQGPEPKPIDWFTGINALLGTMGVAAAVILSIQAIRGR